MFSLLRIVALVSLTTVTSFNVSAGGVALGATRIIYSKGTAQVSLPINNTDENAHFLIQSWVEDASGKKVNDFTVTPPLFAIKPQKENTMRINYTGRGVLPDDRETLYWFNSKAIPQAGEESRNQNTLQIASLTRIKLFVRPAGLELKSLDAPKQLRFSRGSNELLIHNPTPYHITLVSLKDGSKELPNTMVAPLSNIVVSSHGNGPVTFRTINDYGAMTEIVTGQMK